MNISNFNKTKILIVGDLMLDSYWKGSVSRVSPEAPVPIVHIGIQEDRAGGAGNVALNAAKLGANCHLIGLVGNDSVAERLEIILKENQVQYNLLKVDGFKSINKLRILSQSQQLIRLDFEDDFSNIDKKLLLESFKEQLKFTDIVILSDYGKGTLNDIQMLIKESKLANKKVIVDPKGKDFNRYKGASIITPNLAEFEVIVGKCNSEKVIEEQGFKLLKSLELDAILITRGEYGMTLLEKGKIPYHLPTFAREVFDVTGAGDTVVASLSIALASGFNLTNAVKLANIAAGLVVGKVGTATLTLQELQESLEINSLTTVSKIIQLSALKVEIKKYRDVGKKIVMTNGCFDILHPGHITLLEEARALGDYLIVAVNDDKSVQRLKGDLRPINNLSVRMRMLAALECVNWVVSFEEDTPENLYRLILPDILVKGGDYQEDEIIGGNAVKLAGGRVVVLNFIDGFSTTKFINRIKSFVK
jgi:D-beta-D-heptose 7-phosphate kinase / D-beta-D-heptose 1-phosphate adenosyltransferase